MKLIIGKLCFSPRLLTSLLALVFFCLFVFLGFWQLDRAEYKRTLFAEFETRQSNGAISLDQDKIKQLKKEDILWQSVNITGQFLEQYQILLDNQVEQGQAGYYVYTPFKIEGSEQVVLINRGWLPIGNNRQTSPEIVTTNNIVDITGVIKNVPKTGMLLKEALPETLGDTVYRVQRINIEELQNLTGTSLLPYIVRLSADSGHGYRRQWHAPGSGESRHLGYAFQWFAFATVLLVIYLLLNVKKIKQDREHG